MDKPNIRLVKSDKPIRDVTVPDCDGEPMKCGSIVEIAEWSSDSYRGLWYVFAFEAGGGRKIRVLLTQTRTQRKWDLKVDPARLMLRCFEPRKVKGVDK